jgi:tetratricopeptide (TPR) repeat protein
VNRMPRPIAPLAVLLFSVCCATPPRPTSARDQFPLDPREGLAGPFPAGVETGWEALLAGNSAKARSEFARAGSGKPDLAAEIGEIESFVVARDLPAALASCRRVLAASNPTVPLLTACGEAQARSGQALDAWYLYRQAVSSAPGRPGLEKRAQELRTQAAEQLRRQAQEAAGHKQWKEARREAALAIEVDPGAVPAWETAGDIDLEAGDRPAALARFRGGLTLAPGDRTLQEKVARLALELSDYAVAIPVLDALAAQDPQFEAQAERARLAFRLTNWPAAVRAAARSERLTRGQAADLVWWMVPEVREAKVTESVIASDVVGRSDNQEILRAVGLGLLEVDRETHRASPDAPFTLSSAAGLYLRLLLLLQPDSTPACLAEHPEAAVSGTEAIRLARQCAILSESEALAVSGAAFLRALDRVRALAGKGENGEGPREESPK